MNIECEACASSAPVSLYRPNLSSIHNAIRCVACGSTKNRYNREHSRLMSEVVRGTREGPVDEAMVLKGLARHEEGMQED